MGRKIEFFIDNDNGNVKIKDYLKRRGVSHRMLCVLKRTENGILKNGAGARSIDILNSGDTLTLNLPSDEGTASCIYTQKGNKKIRKPQAANQTALIFDRRAAARLLSINSIRRLCWS